MRTPEEKRRAPRTNQCSGRGLVNQDHGLVGVACVNPLQKKFAPRWPVGAYVRPVPICSPVPMFPVFCTLIVVISIGNRLEIIPTPWYDSRLGLCLGFRFRVLVRVRVRLELQTVFRMVRMSIGVKPLRLT